MLKTHPMHQKATSFCLKWYALSCAHGDFHFSLLLRLTLFAKWGFAQSDDCVWFYIAFKLRSTLFIWWVNAPTEMKSTPQSA